MIYYVDNTFNKLRYNPFNCDKLYDNKWIMLKLIESETYKVFTGSGNEGFFQLIITKENIDWVYRVFDFIQYRKYHNNNMTIAIRPSDLEIAKSVYKGHSFIDKFLRSYEPKVVIHSTSKESYQSIMTDNCLKSWNILKAENLIAEEEPIGKILGDPVDYRDYIMFTQVNTSAEIVVASRQKGCIDMDFDGPYVAGARFYFDCEKIAKDGFVRDGAHLKVKDTLPIKEYLMWVAKPKDLGISENTTIRIFAEEADKMFSEKFNMPLPTDTA